MDHNRITLGSLREGDKHRGLQGGKKEETLAFFRLADDALATLG